MAKGRNPKKTQRRAPKAPPWRKYLRLFSDGTIDIELLEAISPGHLAEWMECHLVGRDPYVPLAIQESEPPEALFRDLWKSGGKHLQSALGRAARILLYRVDPEAKEPWLPPLLSFVRDCAPDEARAPMLERLRTDDEVWTRPGVWRDWLDAAASYFPDPDLQEKWKGLLVRVPARAGIAFRALLSVPSEAIRLLPDYWQASSPSERKFLVPKLIAELARENYTALKLLLQRSDLDRGLAELISRVTGSRNASPHVSTGLDRPQRVERYAADSIPLPELPNVFVASQHRPAIMLGPSQRQANHRKQEETKWARN